MDAKELARELEDAFRNLETRFLIEMLESERRVLESERRALESERRIIDSERKILEALEKADAGNANEFSEHLKYVNQQIYSTGGSIESLSNEIERLRGLLGEGNES